MCAIFTDVWKWSQPGLQQVEKLATPLEVILSSPLTSHWKFLSVSWGWPSAMERNLPWSGLSPLIDLGLDSLRECHSSQSFCLYTSWGFVQIPACRSFGFCHSNSLWYFLDVFNHPLLYCTKRTNNHQILCISSCRSLYLLFFSISFSAMFLSNGIVIAVCRWNSLKL